MDDIASDYGLDLRVEIFDERDGGSTGRQFFVQLKATDDSIKKGARVRLRADHIRCWQSLAASVLVVRYWAPDGVLAAIWSWQFAAPA